MRRLTTIALCSATLFGVANAVLADPVAAQQPESLTDCVGVNKSEIDDGLRFELKNYCDRELACRITWKLKCGDAPATLQERRDERFALPADASHGVEASTKPCGNRSWLIENVQWACEAK